MPTVGGVLLFGADRLAHFPDAWIQAGRFADIDKATILDHVEIKTPLVQAVEDAVAFVQKHALRGVTIVIATCREAGLAPPLWEEVGRRLRVTIHTAVKSGDAAPIEGAGELGAATGYACDTIDQSILALLESGGEHGTSEIARPSDSPRVRPGPASSSWYLVDSSATWEPGRTILRDVTLRAAWCVDSGAATRARSWRRLRCRPRPDPARPAARRPCRSAACSAPPARGPAHRRRSRRRQPPRPGRPPGSGPRP